MGERQQISWKVCYTCYHKIYDKVIKLLTDADTCYFLCKDGIHKQIED